MFEAQVAFYLNQYLGKYLTGLDAESLKISVWAGDVQLSNLSLKPEALADLELPVTVKAGLLGKLTLKVSHINFAGCDPLLLGALRDCRSIIHSSADVRTRHQGACHASAPLRRIPPPNKHQSAYFHFGGKRKHDPQAHVPCSSMQHGSLMLAGIHQGASRWELSTEENSQAHAHAPTCIRPIYP